jgi:hypothetical protein
MTDAPLVPRTPKEINTQLRKLQKKMDDYSEGKVRKGSEKRAMEIQRLQRELKGSMKFHIGMVPKPGKLMLIRQFP